MAKPRIHVSANPDGDIKAEIDISKRLIMDRRSGNVISATVKEGTDEFRWMVTAAREWKAL